jgi:ATP-dependent RNA helicase DeaD
LIEKYSRNPQQVRIEQKALTVPTVEQVYYEVDRRYKIDLLTRLIDIHDLKLGIIFCNTKRMVDDLVDHLNAQGYSADRLHGDMTQMMRDRVMQKFRKSGLEFLVATDVAARGLDVDDVEVVFNYDLPYDGEDYVHRIGRTGRKGRSGRAISFASGREVFQIRNIERYTNMRIQRGQPPTANEVEEARTLVFIDKLRAILKSGEYKHHDRLIERLLEEGFASTDIASALIHQLQGGETSPAKPAPQFEERPRAEARPDRRPPFSERREERPAAPAQAQFRPAPARPTRPANAPARTASAPATFPSGAPSPKAVAKPEVKTETKTQAKVVPSPAPQAVAPKPVIKSAPKPPPAVIVRPAAAIPQSTPAEPRPVFKPKQNRKTQPFQTRLWMNIGAELGIVPIDIVNTIAGETGLPGDIVGTVDIRERHLFVDVAAEHANAIIAKLNRAQLKGQKLKAKVA